MPRSLPWIAVVENVPLDEATSFLETFKQYRVSKSNMVPCTICLTPEPHTLAYRLLSCSSPSCALARFQGKCQWRGRWLERRTMRESSIHECGDHSSTNRDSRIHELTEAHKAYLREMAAQGLKPSRIRNSMPRKFGVDMDMLPSLSKVQNFINYYRKKKLLNHDKRKDIADFIHKHEFSGHENDTTAFTFGWTRDNDGSIFVGNGSTENPFVVGVSTKRLLVRMDRPCGTFVFHLDATFKLNQVDYPVIVCGISDRCRSFHIVALFVSSQRTECQYLECLKALRDAYTRVTGKPLLVSTVMGDADDAQFNAVESVRNSDTNFIYVMCFYHLVAKVVERTRGMSALARDRVFRDVYNIHFSRSLLQCADFVSIAVEEWRSDCETRDFAEYFVAEWLQGKFVRWQALHSPGSFATTNNPVEQFNKKLKRDYTLRQRLKMGTLLQQLLSCCHNEACSTKVFSSHVEPSSSLTRRAKELAKHNLLREVFPPHDMSLGLRNGIKFVASSQPRRVRVKPRTMTEDGIAVFAQMGLNYARMEIQNQPDCGWKIDVEQQTCECNMFFKFNTCVCEAMRRNGVSCDTKMAYVDADTVLLNLTTDPTAYPSGSHAASRC